MFADRLDGSVLPEMLAANTVTTDAHDAAGLDGAHRRCHRHGLGEIPEREERRDSRRIERDTAAKRLGLRGKAEAVYGIGDVERLLTETVASDEELALLAIPEREREASGQSLETDQTLLLVEVQDDFAVPVSLLSGCSTASPPGPSPARCASAIEAS
jgi:hypothetical protein